MRRMPSPVATATTAVGTGSCGGARLGSARRGLADPALLLHLLEQVGDADLARAGRTSSAASMAAPMSSVWMWQFQMPSPPTTTIESPMPAHTSLNAGIGLVGRLEEVHDLVAQVADAVVVGRRRPSVAVRRRPAPAPTSARARARGRPSTTWSSGVEQQEEAGAAGVDHAGLASAPAAARACAPARRRPAARAASSTSTRSPPSAGRGRGRLGRLADDGEDRALDRPHDRAVGRLRRRRRAPSASAGAVDGVAARASAVGEAPQDLGEDHARVAPRAHERAVADGLAGRGHVGVGAVELGDHRLEGERHVGAGVAVGHRVDVEPVDAPPGGRASASR